MQGGGQIIQRRLAGQIVDAVCKLARVGFGNADAREIALEFMRKGGSTQRIFGITRSVVRGGFVQRAALSCDGKRGTHLAGEDGSQVRRFDKMYLAAQGGNLRIGKRVRRGILRPQIALYQGHGNTMLQAEPRFMWRLRIWLVAKLYRGGVGCDFNMGDVVNL